MGMTTTRAWFLAAALAAGCSKSEPKPAPPAEAVKPAVSAPAKQAPPAPAPKPAGPLVISLWPSQDDAKIAVAPLAGPFASLDAACKSVKQPTPDGTCEHGPLDTAPTLGAPFLAIERIKATNPDDGKPDDPSADDPSAHWPVVGLAIQTRAGWYVATGLCYSANYTSCDLTATARGDQLVVAYKSSEATSGRWGSEDEDGTVVCAANAAGAVACTPKIATRRSSSSTEDRNDPGGKEDVTFACDAQLHDGHLVVTDAAGAVKGACAKLPYGGDHTIALAF
jgi:hypothetical protein